MGRHSDVLERTRRPEGRAALVASIRPRAVRAEPAEARPTAGAPASFRRPRSRGRVVLGAFAVLACCGIAFVTTIGPAAGSRAAAYYRPAGPAPATNTVQHFRTSAGVVDLVYTRGRWTVVQQPKPATSSTATATATSASKSGGSSKAVASVTVPSGTSQSYAAERVAAKGWGSDQFSCLVSLWNRESGWRVNAANPSGAFGIPQALPGSKMGAGWQTDYKVQINWGLGYIAGSYGSPCGAWAHSNAFNWY